MITCVSKENNLGPGDKIMYFWGLKGPIFLFCQAQLVRKNFLYPYQMLSFYEIKSFTRALRNTDHVVSFPKCPGKWLYFKTKGSYFRSITLIRANCFLGYCNRTCKTGDVADYLIWSQIIFF